MDLRVQTPPAPLAKIRGPRSALLSEFCFITFVVTSFKSIPLATIDQTPNVATYLAANAEGTTWNLKVAGSSPAGITTVVQLVRTSDVFLQTLVAAISKLKVHYVRR